MGISDHENPRMAKDEWLTPPEIINSLGSFDLDPCSPINRPWSTALKHYTVSDNGLIQRWKGRVWCNPPYGRAVGRWLAKCADHGNAIVLIFARTDTVYFQECVFGIANAVLFIAGRLRFYNVDGSLADHTAGAPSCLVAYGAENALLLRKSGIEGVFLPLSFKEPMLKIQPLFNNSLARHNNGVYK